MRATACWGRTPRPGRAREGLCECHDKARNSLHALSREVLCTSLWAGSGARIPSKSPPVFSVAQSPSHDAAQALINSSPYKAGRRITYDTPLKWSSTRAPRNKTCCTRTKSTFTRSVLLDRESVWLLQPVAAKRKQACGSRMHAGR